MKKQLATILILGISMCLFFEVQAQVGVYAAGQGAGISNSIGDFNTYVGDSAGRTMSTGNNATFIGFRAGYTFNNDFDNTAIGAFAATTSFTGVDNVFLGTRAGYNSRASDAVIIGADAGFHHTTGSDPVYIGETAGYMNTTGSDNVFVGEDAGYNNTTAGDNTFIGTSAGRQNTTGFRNTFVGNEAGFDCTVGHHNTAVGDSAGIDMGNVSLYNTFVGAGSGSATEHADLNVFVGAYAGYDNNRLNSTVLASRNTYLGAGAGRTNRQGEDNVGIGALANFNSTVRHRCTFVGSAGGAQGNTPLAGSSLPNSRMALGDDATTLGFSTRATTRAIAIGSDAESIANDGISMGYIARVTGLQGIAIGREADVGAANSIAIGYQTAVNVPNEVYIGNSAMTSIGGIVNWTATSDGRFKKEVKEDVRGLDFILQLRPVTYLMDLEGLKVYHGHTDSSELCFDDKAKIRYSGFIAQEVHAAANASNYHFSGVDPPQNDTDVYGLRYAEFVVPLVKSVQELNEKVEKQAALIEEYEAMFSQMNARLQALEAKDSPKQVFGDQ